MKALGDHHGEQVTSAHLTASVRAHDSQVRSVLSKLVKAGLVVASRGRNGFSSLSRPANKISLLEIYKAVEAPLVFSIHEYPKEKTCRTSCTHKQAMVELLEDTQRAFETRLGQRMLSEMVAKARSYKQFFGRKCTFRCDIYKGGADGHRCSDDKSRRWNCGHYAGQHKTHLFRRGDGRRAHRAAGWIRGRCQRSCCRRDWRRTRLFYSSLFHRCAYPPRRVRRSRCARACQNL